MKKTFASFLLLAISASSLAEEVKNIPSQFRGLWADSVRTCKTKAPATDFMLLVRITPQKIEGQYTESSYTYTPVRMETYGENNGILNTASYFAPYYDEDGEDQQKPTLQNMTLFLKNGGLYILPNSEIKLIKCS